MDTKKKTLTTNHQVDSIPLIMIVDDDEDNCLLLEHTIAMFGWKSTVASDAVEALAKVKQQQPDLILLDIVMPYVNGFQLAMMLRSQRETREIPLIAVTGLVREREQDLIFAFGFKDYLSKPFLLKDIQRAILSNLNI